MADEKAEQYLNLVDLLEQTSFTNKPAFDAQLREKFASLMITNFIFMRVTPQESETDLVVLSEEPEPTPTPAPTKPKAKRKTKKRRKKEASAPEADVQKVDSRGRPMNTYIDADLDDLEHEVKSMPTPKKKRAPKAPPSGAGLPNYAALQQEMYETEDLGGDSQHPQMTAEELMQTFPELSSAEASAALQKDLQKAAKYLNPQKGLSGDGIKRLKG